MFVLIDFCAAIEEIFFQFQASAVDVPEEGMLMMEDPDQPGESRFTGLLLGGFDQHQSFQEVLPRWRVDRTGGLEQTAQAGLVTPVSPGKWRHSRQMFQGLERGSASSNWTTESHDSADVTMSHG